MGDYRLKTLSGEQVRNIYQFFEWEALKHADANNLPANTDFLFGNSKEKFTVDTNNDEFLKVFRHKNGKLIEAKKVYADAPVNKEKPVKTETTETTNNNTNNMETKNNNTEIEKALQNLTNLIMQTTQNSQSSIDMAQIEALIDKKLSEAKTINIKINDVPKFKTEKTLHPMFEDVLFWATQKQPIYLFGPAGTGKNVLSEQVAEALNLPFYYAGCLQQKYELEGFINASGEYQETEFYKAFTEGGVFLFDEIDGTAAEVLIAFNEALANGYYNFPKHGKTKAHENFIVIAAGNTAGRGASDAYNGRFQLDASTLDRFGFIELEYNKDIELVNANQDAELVEFAHALRYQIENQCLTYTFSTRAIKRIAIASAAGMDIKKALKQSLCGGWAVEDIKLLQSSLSDENNKYTKAFKNIKF